jgi:hypothetical protein
VNLTDQSNTVDVDLTYTRTFNKPQREFSLLTQYSRNIRTNDFVRSALSEDDLSVTERLKNLNDSYNQEVTVQADYQTPIARNQMLEVGGKGIMRKVTSDFQYLADSGRAT